MIWRRIEGQERICATDTCSREPFWCLDVGGVASVYCDKCKKRIEWVARGSNGAPIAIAN